MDYRIKLTQQELQMIFQGLGELPLKASLVLFGNLQKQMQDQDKANAVELVSE